MIRMLMIVCIALTLSACGAGVDDSDGEPSRFVDDGGNVKPGEDDGVDYCAEFGWYSDGTCDEICQLPDPDCLGSEEAPSPCRGPRCGPAPAEPDPEPEPSDPPPDDDGPGEPSCELPEDTVYHEVSDDPDECARITFSCPQGQDPIFNECGCGCLEPTYGTLPVSCLDDSLPTVDRLGDPDECATIRYVCEDGWEPFVDDCGCGCKKADELCYDDSSEDVEVYGIGEECTRIDFACSSDMEYFDDACGCGCKRPDICLTDADCEGGSTCQPVACPFRTDAECPNESVCVVF